MNHEIWIPILSTNGKYSISSIGNIRNNKTGYQLKIGIGKQGYKQVVVRPNGIHNKCKLLKVHREIAIAFIPNPDNFPVINHKDGNKLNNSLDNLEWCTVTHNNKHAREMGLVVYNPHKGHEHSQSKLSKEDREFILKNYSRYDVNCTGRALAKKFGVDKMQIYRIIKRGY